MLLPLKTGTIYGPICSRRYGRSLGINLMPTSYKLCSFNCVYCHYGFTDVCTADLSPYAEDLPTPEQVNRELEEVLSSDLELDQITFSGNGEPTLHPQFPEIVTETMRLRDEYRPATKLALLSNASGLANHEVRECIEKIDLPVFKLDNGTARKFLKVNRPARGISFDQIVGSMIAARGIYIQTVLVEGNPCNSTAADLAAYYTCLADIQPVEIHLYSIDRPVPNQRIMLVSPERLQKIAAEIQTETGITARAYYGSR